MNNSVPGTYSVGNKLPRPRPIYLDIYMYIYPYHYPYLSYESTDKNIIDNNTSYGSQITTYFYITGYLLIFDLAPSDGLNGYLWDTYIFFKKLWRQRAESAEKRN